jgi:acetyltransferase
MRRMEAFILASNDQMIKFARQLGFAVHRDPDDPGMVLARREL